MTYTGNVHPGGPADIRTLERLEITKVAVDPTMSNNCYILRCRTTGDALLIDAADSAETLEPLLDGVTTIVTTHQHWDHHRALAALAEGREIIAGAPDADAITAATGVAITRRVDQGDTIRIGETSVEVIAIRGHTPGSIALLHHDPAGTPHLWTGDSLFPGGVGGTFGNEAAFAELITDVEERIFQRLPDETWFYPGHGNDSTLGAERPHLAEWRERGW